LAHGRRVETLIRLEGFYPPSTKDRSGKEVGRRETADLMLPRVLNTFDRDGRVTVVAPDGFEVRGAVHEWERNSPASSARPLEEQSGKPPTLSLSLSRAPAHLELSWLPVNALIPVRSVVDVTLEDRQTSVFHSVTLPKSTQARQILWQSAE